MTAGQSPNELPPDIGLAFAPLHKRALGMALGCAAALLVAGVTGLHLLRSPEDSYPLYLLNQYFYGYSVSPAGMAVGGAWAFVAGFAAGWFLAFTRNFAIAATIFIARTRAELAATRDFLDHI